MKSDCEQSLFFSKIRGEERKTSSRASVPGSVTYERRYRGTLVARASEKLTVTLARSFVLRSSPQFSRKRETAHSLL